MKWHDELTHERSLRMHKMFESESILILVSHDTNLLGSMCTSWLCRDHGPIKEDGPVDVVPANYLPDGSASGG
jgi:ABC-type polysaccharide/polyol phosphate transport system ATPase subunit